MTPEQKHRLIIEMDSAAENASSEGGNDFERMRAALSVAEKAIGDAALEEAATFYDNAIGGSVSLQSVAQFLRAMKSKP